MKTQHTRFALSILLTGALSLTIAGCNPPAETSTPAAPSTTVGTKIDDSVVTTRVKSALLSDPSTKSFDISVETRKGEVQLSGFVDNQAKIDRAIEVARNVEGVQSVTNKMSVKQ